MLQALPEPAHSHANSAARPVGWLLLQPSWLGIAAPFGCVSVAAAAVVDAHARTKASNNLMALLRRRLRCEARASARRASSCGILDGARRRRCVPQPRCAGVAQQCGKKVALRDRGGGE